MTIEQEAVERLHNEYRRQVEENKKLKDAEEECLACSVKKIGCLLAFNSIYLRFSLPS